MGDLQTSGSDVVIVDALRTPFVRAFGDFSGTTQRELSGCVVQALLNRNGLSADAVDRLIWSSAIPDPRTNNLARDVVIASHLSPSIPCYTLSQACISSFCAMDNAACMIRQGTAQLVVAGGVEVMSAPPIFFSRRGQDFFLNLNRDRSTTRKIKRIMQHMRPKLFRPESMCLTEMASGLTMGEHGELMATAFRVNREEQDQWTNESHLRAALAWEDHDIRTEVVPCFGRRRGSNAGKIISEDDVIRRDSTMESLRRLRPVFDKHHGTVTAGNSSTLTDGAAGLLLASRDFAEAKGLQILGRHIHSVTVAMDPRWHLLIGPALAVPQLMRASELSISDIDLFEIHEAFGAQILACLRALEDPTFCLEHLGITQPFGSIPRNRINVDGGSLAYGHPLAATGARLVSRALRTGKRLGAKRVLTTACAGGGFGHAALFEIPA